MARKLKTLSGGAQFDVMADKDKVYKKPKKNILMYLYGEADYEQITKDIDKIKAVFKDYYLETKVEKISQNYTLIQDYIKEGKELTCNISDELKLQLKDILDKNQVLVKKYGQSLDFLGNKGNLRALRSIFDKNYDEISIANIMEIDGCLKIVDLDLLDIKFTKHEFNPLHVITDWISYKMSRYFLSKMFEGSKSLRLSFSLWN